MGSNITKFALLSLTHVALDAKDIKMSRIMFRFWLDNSKEDENALIGEVGELKANRKFTETIRQGIELITDLRNGSLRVLFDLFPYVKAEFLEYMQSLNNAESSEISKERQQLDAYKAELDAYRQELEQRYEQLEQERLEATRKQNAHVQKQLDRIENFLVSQGNVPINTIAGSSSNQNTALPDLKPIGAGSGGVPKLDVPQIKQPIFDDDDDDLDLVVTKASGAGSNASANFLRSMMALQEN